MSRRRLELVRHGVNAVAAVAPQLFALLLLETDQYGAFSLVYLVYALGNSVVCSSVAEASSRTSRREGEDDTWADYSAVLAYVSLAVGLLAGAAAIVVNMPIVGALVSVLAVGAGAWRFGSRYWQVRRREIGRALLGDVLCLIGISASWLVVLLSGGARTATTAAACWAIGLVLASAVSRRPTIRGWRILRAWWATHTESIKALQGESALMDLGSIGTPLVTALFLPIDQFGIYRAMTSVGAPVGLILDPLRPVLARVRSEALLGPRLRIAVGVTGIGLGVAVAAALAAAGRWELPVATIVALSGYFLAAGVYVAGSMIGHYYYLVVRLVASGSWLMRMRIIQTTLVGVLPIAGAAIAGLVGAVWGLAVAVLVSGSGWAVVGLLAGRRVRVAGQDPAEIR